MRHCATAPGLGFEAMIASRFGREDVGTGGGAPLTPCTDRLEGIGGGSTIALLLNPSDRADRTGRCGGGIMALFVSTAVADRLGSAGTRLSGERSEAFVGCLGGSDGLDGRATIHVSDCNVRLIFRALTWSRWLDLRRQLSAGHSTALARHSDSCSTLRLLLLLWWQRGQF